ncbi:MAG TPA: alpha/beta fold hydrolase [Candidatus Methylomirabilis sp.]|nr:alpha/beta fold hydrolase [Candidatus Methylomirabilis sp.]
MKGAKALRALAGVGLCGLGLWLVLGVPYHPRTFRVDAGGCRLITDIAEPAGDSPKGYVVLLHGISASKTVMSYFAQGFQEEGLRVFVPDLPGHGRTNGPFSPARAEQCSESLVRELVARGLLDPERTFLAGHSMGGAIALRVASRIPVAGVIAISPAPMGNRQGIPQELIPFPDLGTLPAHSLVMSAAWEPEPVQKAARDLVPSPGDGTSEYLSVPRASHVSILFDSLALFKSEKWAAQVLRLSAVEKLPSHRRLLGFFAGFAGILLLAGPFLRELLQSNKAGEPASEVALPPARGRMFLEWVIIALATIGILIYWTPLRALHLFEGDYFASFLLILGVALVAMHWSLLPQLCWAESAQNPASSWRRYYPILAAVVAAFILFFLFMAWLDLAFTEVWVTAARWARFAPFFLAVLPYHAAEELLLGPAAATKGWQRLAAALLLRLLAFGAILAGVFLLHSGQILLVILAAYFALFCMLQLWAMNLVRQATRSPAAAALFGAILLTGFCLVVFPTT